MSILSYFPDRNEAVPLWHHRKSAGFTILEVLVGTTILMMLMVVLFGIFSGVSSAWQQSTQRIDAFQSARVAFDRVTRMLSQATLNVYWDYDDPNQPTVYRRQSELAFAVLQTGSDGFSGAGTGHGVFFQVPIGKTEKTSGPDFRPLSQMLSSVGFSVRWVGDKNIRPPFITGPEKFRLRLMQYQELSENLSVFTDPDPAAGSPPAWIKAMSDPGKGSPLADNIIWMAIWPRRSIVEDPEGDDLTADYTYNSRKGAKDIPQPVSANQLPPAVQVTMIAIDEKTAARLPNGGMDTEIVDAYAGTLASTKDYQEDMERITKELNKAGINFRVFTTTVLLRESRWSP